MILLNIGKALGIKCAIYSSISLKYIELNAFYDKYENVKEALKNHDIMLDYISLCPFVNFDTYTKPCCIGTEM